MIDRQNERLTDAELHAFFDRLFPQDLAGADVLAEIVPEGWEHSPLVACFHPSVSQRYEEAVQFHRNLESLRDARPRRDGRAQEEETLSPEPTLEEIRGEYQPEPVKANEQVTELVGCVCGTSSPTITMSFSRTVVADIGSFRGAGAFLDEHVTRGPERCSEGDYLRFFLGTIWISRRADLTPVYAMIPPRYELDVFQTERPSGLRWPLQAVM